MLLMAFGVPCLIAGLALHYQIERMISVVNSAAAPPESVASSTEWIIGTYWPVPYLLWVGITLTVLAGVIAVVALIDAKSSSN